MARRQPSSILSICISLILLTSSVRTLKKKKQTAAKASNCTEPILCKTLGNVKQEEMYLSNMAPTSALCTLSLYQKFKLDNTLLKHINHWSQVQFICFYAGNSLLPLMYLSKMAPTPALCALSRCSSEARRTPSFNGMERWENEAIRSSFHPEKLNPFTHICKKPFNSS